MRCTHPMRCRDHGCDTGQRCVAAARRRSLRHSAAHGHGYRRMDAAHRGARISAKRALGMQNDATALNECLQGSMKIVLSLLDVFHGRCTLSVAGSIKRVALRGIRVQGSDTQKRLDERIDFISGYRWQSGSVHRPCTIKAGCNRGSASLCASRQFNSFAKS